MIDNKVSVYKCSDRAFLPSKATEMSACYDIRACLHIPTVKFSMRSEPLRVVNFEKDNSYILLYPDDLALIPTGLIFCLPSSHHLKIYSRSGNVWKRMITVANQPAVIDSDYTKETYVLLHNRSMNVQKIKHGDAIAQCEICENVSVNFDEIDNNEFQSFVSHIKKSSSRNGGLGSTGR